MDSLFTAMAWIAITYIALVFALALRLGALRRRGVAGAPSAIWFLLHWLGIGAVMFLFSGRHKALKDKTTSALTLICRVLFSIYAPVFIVLFAVTSYMIASPR